MKINCDFVTIFFLWGGGTFSYCLTKFGWLILCDNIFNILKLVTAVLLFMVLSL